MSDQSVTSLQEINERVMRDDALREKLLRHPVETLRTEFGVGVPENVRVEVHEETSDVIHLVIPGRVPESRVDDDTLDDIATMMPRGDRTGCCTCGSSTSQTFSSIQNGCGC
jgi:hypothetical protein